jgi:hypothetical protein
MLADRAWIWCISCWLLHVSLFFSLPKRLGDSKHRLEVAQRLVSILHAVWMFIGAAQCWAHGECTLRNDSEPFQGYLRIAEFSKPIDARIDHMLGYLIADQVLHHHISDCFLFSNFLHSVTRYFN